MRVLKKKDTAPAARSGFTLVEILIVIAIIAMLSTLAVSGYTSYRRSALLDFSADSIVSQIYEFRDNTIHGDFGGGRGDEVRAALEDAPDSGAEETLDVPDTAESRCYGFYFTGNGNEFAVSAFSQPFKNKKVWRGPIKGWVYEGCGETFDPNNPDNFKEEFLDMDKEMVKIENVSLFNGGSPATAENFVMRFVPPKGELEIFVDDLLLNEFDEFDGNSGVQFQIKYGKDDDLRYKRLINFDFNSLTASVANVE